MPSKKVVIQGISIPGKTEESNQLEEQRAGGSNSGGTDQEVEGPAINPKPTEQQRQFLISKPQHYSRQLGINLANKY